MPLISNFLMPISIHEPFMYVCIVSDFSCRNKTLVVKILKLGYHIDKFRRACSKFYRRHCGLMENIM